MFTSNKKKKRNRKNKKSNSTTRNILWSVIPAAIAYFTVRKRVRR